MAFLPFPLFPQPVPAPRPRRRLAVLLLLALLALLALAPWRPAAAQLTAKAGPVVTTPHVRA